MLEHVRSAQINGQELGGHIGMCVGVLAVRDEHTGACKPAQLGIGREHPVLSLAHVGVRSPQDRAVTNAVLEGAERLRLIHVLDYNVLLGEAEDTEP